MMKLEAIDLFIPTSAPRAGSTARAPSAPTATALGRHADDVDGRDPRHTNRADVKRTLARWPNPNTRRTNRSILVSFYDWTMQELEPGPDRQPGEARRGRRRSASRRSTA
jgi:hypothetical protein